MTPRVNEQLTFEVAEHPRLKTQPGGGLLIGSITVAGSLACDRDLQDGDMVVVTVSDADGTVLCSSHAEIQPPAFKALKLDGERVGTERAHKAKIGDPV